MDGLVKPTTFNSRDFREYWEYLIVIDPDQDIYRKVMDEKHSFSETYRQKSAVRNTPHIALASFAGRETMEETLIRWIQRVCSQVPSFEVTLNNYSGIPNHTVYLRIQDQSPLNQLCKQLRVIDQYVQSSGSSGVKFNSNFHLSIAGRLPDVIYDKDLKAYSLKTFCERFKVKELMLLKRVGDYESYKMVTVFPLLP